MRAHSAYCSDPKVKPLYNMSAANCSACLLEGAKARSLRGDLDWWKDLPGLLSGPTIGGHTSSDLCNLQMTTTSITLLENAIHDVARSVERESAEHGHPGICLPSPVMQ